MDAYAILVAPGPHVAEQLGQWIAGAGDVPCLVISPHDDPTLMNLALEAGAVDYLPAVETDARRFERALRFATRRQIRHAQVLEREWLLSAHRERDRHQLAVQLHDGPLQDLIGARFQLSMLGAPELEPQVAEVQQSLLSVMQAVRELCSHLKPPALAPFGLEKAIRAYAQGFGERNPALSLVLELDADQQKLPEWVRMALYRIVQKALSNIEQHAEAANVSIQFHLGDARIRLKIADDGKGFVLPEHAAGAWLEFARMGRFGLLGMYERVHALRGRFMVQSNPGSGTRIIVDIPREQPAGVTTPVSTASSAAHRENGQGRQ
jgi:signal transduction histidine kinase